MPFTHTQITRPSHEPVSLQDMKDWARISTTDQDAVLTGLIKSSRIKLERWLRRCLVNQQWSLKFDKFPGSWPFSYGFGATLLSPYREIHLPFCPAVSVDSFQYIDQNTGDLVDMVEGVDYQVSLAEPARLQPGYGMAWPVARWVLDAVQIKYTVGYGDTSVSPELGTDPPEDTLTAIKLATAHFYENRESQDLPDAAKNLVSDLRVVDFAPVLNNWERFGR